MNNIEGWIREKFRQDVNKAMIVRKTGIDVNGRVRYRVVYSHYFDHLDTSFTLRHGKGDDDVEKSFKLPIDNELYRRSATNVFVFDWDSGNSLSFSKNVVLGFDPLTEAQVKKTKQIKVLVNRERKPKESNMWMAVGFLVTAVVCISLGVFLGYYLTSTGAIGAHASDIINGTSPLPTSIIVLPPH